MLNNKELTFFFRIFQLVPKGINKIIFYDFTSKLLTSDSSVNFISFKNLNKIHIFNNECYFIINKFYLLFYLKFFKNYNYLQCKQLVDMTCVDYLNNKLRFNIIYSLLSLKYNIRVFFKVELEELELIESAFYIYQNANWLEREIWDLFGIFFANHPDLRRILTDYGFNGFPLRKNFPLSGFVEIRYDDEKKYLFYEKIELSQEFRNFNFVRSWETINHKNYIYNYKEL